MKKIIAFLIIISAACKAFAVTGDITLEVFPEGANKEYIYYLGGEEVARELIDPEGNILEKAGHIPDGEVRHIEEGRVKSIWKFKSNKRNGIHKEYFETGKIKFTGTYKDDALTGKFKSFNEDGSVKAAGSFGENGFSGVVYAYTGGGALEIAETYKNGELFSTKEYFANGKLKNEWFWEGGFFHGICRTFYENGKVASLDTYKNGRMIRREVWDGSGNIKFCRTYAQNENQNHVQYGQERGWRENTNAENVHGINQQHPIKGNNIILHK